MKTNRNDSVATNNKKTIHKNSLFTDITAQEEVFVRGGAQYDESGPGIVHRKSF